MLEREGVTESVRQLVRATRLGHGGSLFVVGEPGLGKTAVLDFARAAAAPDVRVGLGRGDVMETGLPFGLFAQAIDDVGGGDVLDAVAPSAPPGDVRGARFYRALRWLQAVAADGPVLLAFDDLHWGDGDSLALLSYLCRRIHPLPVAVVATLRPWPPAAEDVCLRLASAGHAQVERLGPFSEDAARALLAARVGGPVAEDVVAQAWVSSAGNPLLLKQLALAVEREGALADASRPWPAGQDSLFLRRFSGLPEGDLRLARAASVLGRRFPAELAIAVAGLDEGEAAPALDALSRSGLVRHVGTGTAEFTHLPFRQALYDDLSPLVREELHARAFGLLVERGMEAEAAEHAVRADLAGEPAAVEVLRGAARAALRAGAVATAIERLEAAERLSSPRPDPEVLLLLGEARLAGGQGVLAARVYERLLEQPDLPLLARVEALRMLGRASFMKGAAVEGKRRFEEAVEKAGADRPAVAVQALLDHSRAAWLTAGPVAALPAIERARQVARRLDEAVRIEVEAAWGFVAFAAGDPAGLEAAATAGRWAATDDRTAVRDLAWNWGTLRNSGRAAKYAERFDEAEAVFAATFAQAEDSGSPHAIVSLAAHHADTLARRGRLDEGLTLATRATALAELAPMAEAFAYAARALILLQLDRVDESDRCCEQAERTATIRGQWLPLLRVWHLRARRLFDEGRFDQASRLYDRLAARTEALGVGEPCLVPWARHAVVTHLRHGAVAEAQRVVEWVEGCADRLPCRWPRMAASAGRASLADASGDAEGAETGFRAALSFHDGVDLPIERAETLVQLGTFLRRAGRLVDARAVLREALAVAEDTGARRLAGSVHAELLVAGGRRRRRGSPEGLTAQEQRVAELAGAGRSSTEIARHLSLSVRTIETHLGRIYAKLGIHSQRELMAAARPWTPAPPSP